MSKIYYEIKPSFSHVARYVPEGNFERVYDLVYEITNSHYKSDNASSWCELASVGETYNTDEFTIIIVEDFE